MSNTVDHPVNQQHRFGFLHSAAWLMLTVLGYMLAEFFHFPGGYPPFNGANFSPGSAVVGLIFGAFSGLFIGGLQWILLRSWIPHAARWIAASMVGFGIIHAMADSFPDHLIVPAVVGSGGMILGLAQWAALRRSVPQGFWWIVASEIGWIAGFQLGFVLSDEGYNQPVAGLVMGGITGLTLRWLLRDAAPIPRRENAFVSRVMGSKIAVALLVVLALILLAGFAVLAGFVDVGAN